MPVESLDRFGRPVRKSSFAGHAPDRARSSIAWRANAVTVLVARVMPSAGIPKTSRRVILGVTMGANFSRPSSRSWLIAESGNNVKPSPFSTKAVSTRNESASKRTVSLTFALLAARSTSSRKPLGRLGNTSGSRDTAATCSVLHQGAYRARLVESKRPQWRGLRARSLE
jgi:hypothetical protein